MRNYVYNTKETALNWIGSYFANHCWVTSRLTLGWLTPTTGAIKKYLQENMANSGVSSEEGRYAATSKGVEVSSADNQETWEFTWSEVSKVVVDKNKIYHDDKLPIPINSSYFKANFTEEQGFSIIVNWLLRSFLLNLDFLISNREIELTTPSVLEKLLEYNEKNFFVGRQYLNLETLEISHQREVRVGEKIPVYKGIELFYSPEGSKCAYAHATEQGIEFSSIDGHISYLYSWESIANGLVMNKQYLLTGCVSTVASAIEDTPTKTEDVLLADSIVTNESEYIEEVPETKVEVDIIVEEPQYTSQEIKLTSCEESANLDLYLSKDGTSLSRKQDAFKFKEIQIKAVLNECNTLSQLSLF